MKLLHLSKTGARWFFFRKRNLVRPIFTPKLLCHFTFITNYLSVLTVNERAGFKMSPQRVPLNFQILSGRSKALPGEAAGEYSLVPWF